MVFECQNSPYLREFSSEVVSCVPAFLEQINNGKKEKLEGFEVILKDTILFPEGGGQPDDRGTLNGIPVLQVKRKGTEAVHFITNRVENGAVANIVVNWERRWDHMQQHSGQHLITAIADASYGLKTTSWWLGETVSHIEIDSPVVTDEQIQHIEETVNEKIRAGVSVEVKVYEEGDPALKEARTRGLPNDHHGPVRIVTITGVDSNMCCGTHVSNLSHLQAIKLLQCEKGKKNKSNLFFISGNRVLDYINRSLQRERRLTTILKNGPEDHIDLVTKLQSTAKIYAKNMQSLMRELAGIQAEKIKSLNPKYYIVHRRDGDIDFINVLLSELSSQDVTLLITVGEDNSGQMALSSSPEIVQELGPKICEVFLGKGAAKGKRFQAKVTQLSNAARQQAESILAEYFK